MQFLSITNDTSLPELGKQVGARNLDLVLNTNMLTRAPNVGQQYTQRVNDAAANTPTVDWQRKSSVLNTLTADSDIFEHAALLGGAAWKALSSIGSFPNLIKIPETVQLPDSNLILGNGVPVQRTVYQKAMNGLANAPHEIDPTIFNEYSSRRSAQILEFNASSNPLQWFNLPWGQITLYSSLGNDSMDFPVYPEELQDGVKAVYDTMPEMLYQYEPWNIYKSSGPRTNVYKFTFHRDMWTGDHKDGNANRLIRFCEANCYPEFRGAAVHTATVVLYVAGKPLISGILTDVSVDWNGPLGHDGWYLMCEVSLSITEVAPQPLNYQSVRRKGLIG